MDTRWEESSGRETGGGKKRNLLTLGQKDPRAEAHVKKYYSD